MSEFDLHAGTTDFYVDPLYYDHEFSGRTGDIEWYGEHYQDAGGPVLELGVGTARIAARAVRKGATVIGLDLSPTMLVAAAERRAKLPKARRPHLQLVQGDMRRFAFDHRFEMIGCPFNAFQHLYTREDVEACLGSVRDALEPGGLFLFDVLLPDLDYLTRPPMKRFQGVRFKHPTYGVHYTYSEQSAYDPVRQINQMWFHYDRADDSDHEAPSYFCIQLSHRCFFPQELQALLHYNGFEVLVIHGDFEGGALRADSESLVVMCTPR